jgi:2'-5' RNA ligase
MGNLVIVAIPEEQDRVWKISSEQVPHLTLLFLGDEAQADTQQIMQFVEHAVTLSEHGQFYLDVERRGELGPDNADVLFFSKRSWNLKWIKQFRGQLLQNSAVKTAYDSTQQYDEWTPHLTLGYPETPAKADPNEEPFGHPIYSVCFDRIAVWDTDFNGPEFRLEWPERELSGDLAVAYSATQKAGLPIHAEDALEHVGIKGMRWGRRKTETVTVGGKEKKVTPRKAAKLDKKWEKKIYSLPGAIDVHNKMADHFNQRIGGVNDKFKDVDFSKTKWDKPDSWSPREKQYNNEIEKLTTDGNRKAVEEVHGTSPTGKRKAELSADGSQIVVHEVKLKHAADDTTAVAVLNITRNSEGLITKAEPLQLEDSMKQTAELGKEFLEHKSVLDNATLSEQIKAKIQSILDDVTGGTDKKDVSLFGDPLIRTKIQSVLEDFYKDPNVDNAVVYDALGEAFIEHWGVKGMRWGFRRSGTTPSPVSSQSTHTLLRGKAKVQAQGGEHHPAHEDAIKVAEAKQKLKKSGVAALSNKDLQDVATRLNLENQVAVLTSHKGKKFVTNQLHEEGKNVARRGIREGLKRGAKRAAKVAGTTAAVAAA